MNTSVFLSHTVFSCLLYVRLTKKIRIRTETYKKNIEGLYRKPYYHTAASEQSFAAFSFILLHISTQRVIFAKRKGE